MIFWFAIQFFNTNDFTVYFSESDNVENEDLDLRAHEDALDIEVELFDPRNDSTHANLKESHGKS